MSKKETFENQQNTKEIPAGELQPPMSKAARKMLKKAKKEKKHRFESGLFLFMKILMLAFFLYSGVFYGGVTVVGVLKGYMYEIPKWIAGVIGIGSLIILAGIILSFCKRYFISFAAILAGTLSYLKGAVYIINKISDKLVNYDGADSQIAKMDKTYMLHYYPIMGVLLIALILGIIALIKMIRKKKRLKEQRDNAPVKSIIN